jgi:hypothetical protein
MKEVSGKLLDGLRHSCHVVVVSLILIGRYYKQANATSASACQTHASLIVIKAVCLALCAGCYLHCAASDMIYLAFTT